jgi:hypothetical protein
MGGPNASGVLVANRALFRSNHPERPGGGTVDYVGGIDRAHIDYVGRLDEREEGGTPSIIGDLRAGVAFLLKEMLDPSEIALHEVALASKAIHRLSQRPRIHLYGPTIEPRLPILSFNVEGLHHDFVSTLLDHLFGIQNRAGCSCAGPYGHRLLGIDAARSELYRTQIARGLLGIKPGWVRISLPYYGSDQEIDFVLSAVEFVADHGDAFLPLYHLGFRDGIWTHIENPMRDAQPIELTAKALGEAALRYATSAPLPPAMPPGLDAERAGYLEEAERLAAHLRARYPAPEYRKGIGDGDVDRLIWFRFVHGSL